MTSLPLMAACFEVVFDSDAPIGFATVEGLARSNEVITLRDGFSTWLGPRVAVVPAPGWVAVTLTRASRAEEPRLARWIASPSARRLQVSLLDAAGRARTVWRAPRAVPVRLAQQPLSASSGDPAVETLELLVDGLAVAPA